MKQIKIFFAAAMLALCVFVIAAWTKNNNNISVRSVASPPLNASNDFYTSNKNPLQPLHFIKLPIGSIQPQGWLLKYLHLQRDGLTGHLGEISAWLEKKDNAWLSKDGTGSHGWEEVPYWLKGYGDLAYLLKDTAMINETKFWLNAVLQSQREDGYFGPLSLKNGKPDLWANMIMLWCLQSYYDYSNDNRVIPFMTKYFQWELNLPDSMFLKDYWENSRGGDNLYSVYWLYNRTGDNWLLDLAKKIHRNTANWEQKNNLPNWHNVNIAQSFREPATYFLQSNDSNDLKATYNDFELVRKIYGQVPGGMFGADENARPGYTDPRQAIETCGIVEQMASDEMLLRFTGNPLWADNCEDVMFNTFPAALMPDFKALRYLTAPNMVVSDDKNHHPDIANEGPFLMMNPFSSRCCQHNHAQGLPYYSENLWMATPDNGLAAVLYNANTVNAKVSNGTNISIEERTNYPFDENIQFIIHTKNKTNFPLYLRIPQWCNNASIFINGKKASSQLTPDAYAQISNDWKEGDKITLNLPMKISVKKWTANKNSVSVNYGPLTFSLKMKERIEKMDSRKAVQEDSHWQENADPSKYPAYNLYAASAWNYGLVLSNDTANWKVIHKPFPKDSFPFTPENVPLEIVNVQAKQISSWVIDKYGLCAVLPESPVNTQSQTNDITLIPMGATRLRISAFPTIAKK
ncbi:hypothetical protein A9P82_12675 [Arachidicoccus ginsenosidimutans]|uniref:beta-L-arabinofuranosidase domain-containing protein n=1 Tax=Arachidicoccus sp. BS20 TaxID=1850526 RepID=UPI0007F14377|nr:beta-L-arabinofuranosidase domain-containing protein [Arachidicoccus sp. BS20]ANI90062.1 hypothetical protein A9P82_12675 [Arachidicoccus sp. BS20]